MNLTRLPFLALSLAFALSCPELSCPLARGAIVHTSTPDGNYIAYGNSFDSVLWGERYNAAGSLRSRFSGVLVTPNWVITSAHALEELSSGGSVRFGTGSHFTNDRGFNQASSTYYQHPTFDISTFVGYDLGLVYFPTPFPVLPAEFYRGPLVAGDYSVVGFGRTGPPGVPPLPNGFIRGGINVVEADLIDIPSLPEMFGYRFVDSTNPNFRELGSLIQPGDSGGGWFFDDGNGLKLAGISSSGLPNDAGRMDDYGSISLAAKLDFRWIDSFLDPATVPEPSSLALLALAGGTVWLKRRRGPRRQCVTGTGFTGPGDVTEPSDSGPAVAA